MNELFRIEIDGITGEVNEIPLTPEEIEEMQKRHEEGLANELTPEQAQAQEQAKINLKNSARAKLIAGQPLTEEEAAVLVI